MRCQTARSEPGASAGVAPRELGGRQLDLAGLLAEGSEMESEGSR